MMIDVLWDYIVANSATLITSYLGILLTLYMRKKETEKTAINAYLSNLGMYIENLMLPNSRYLAKMKILFAKHYGVNIECFPIKRKAIRQLFFLYRSNPSITLQRQYRLYNQVKIVKSHFIKDDSLVQEKAQDIWCWKQRAQDFSLAFAFLMFMFSLQIIYSPEKLRLLEILLLIVFYALVAFLTSLLLPILSFIFKRIRCK